MGTEPILNRFDDLSIWKKGDQRAAHKPLLVLYTLGRWQRGQSDVTFREAEPDLTALLREFGPPRKSDHPEQPFWRLQRDGVWTVHAPAGLALEKGADIPRVTARPFYLRLSSSRVMNADDMGGAPLLIPVSPNHQARAANDG